MKIVKTLLLSLTILLSGGLTAQDVHFTLFNMSPLTMNPALTGAYEGTVRIGGIYRDQYRSVVSNAITTPSFYADAPILMVGKRHWVGVGLMAYRDQAGTGKLQTSTGQISGAFHLALDKKATNVLTLGVQWGQVTRKFTNGRALEFEDQIVGELSESIDHSGFNLIGGAGGSSDKNYTDINVGLLLKSQVNKTTDFNVGISARHVNNPKYAIASFGDAGEWKMRFTAHGQLNAKLNDKWSIAPTFYYTNMSPASQFQIQGWTGYDINPEQDIALNFGLGYRIADAGQILLGMDYKDLKVALGYDVTLSSLSDANSYRGGFEIAVWYIVKIFKKPVVKPAIICPHL